MTSETIWVASVAGGIGSMLTAAIYWLIKWIRESVDRERKTLIDAIEVKDKQINGLQDSIHNLESKRLEDSREAISTVNEMSHDMARAIRQVAVALTSRRR